MNIDEYLNNLQADLDNQLSKFGLGRSQTSSPQPEEDFSDFKFCPECGTKVDAGANFCPNCGTRLDSLEEEPEQVEENSFCENPDDEQVGVIFTDTQRLGEKYSCSQDEVKAVIESFSEQSREHGPHTRPIAELYHSCPSDRFSELCSSYGWHATGLPANVATTALSAATRTACTSATEGSC